MHCFWRNHLHMANVERDEIVDYVQRNIGEFHRRRLESLGRLKLVKLLQRKNPYLFKAKNINKAQDLVKVLLDAHLSSQEEGIFGDFLEGLAIFINGRVFGGRKSSTEGIDLEFDHNSVRYIVAIKSGPNWGNSQQVKRMKANFSTAKRVLATSQGRTNVVAVNGCCYGRTRKEHRGEYTKLCGQKFWQLISDDTELYKDLIQPLGHEARQRNEQFCIEYDSVINRFTSEFCTEYCEIGGQILWDKIVAINSSAYMPKASLQRKKR